MQIVHRDSGITEPLLPRATSAGLLNGSLADFLLMIDRIIDWQGLAAPLLRLRRQGDFSIEPLDTLLRSYVATETPSVLPELNICVISADEDVSRFHSRLSALGMDEILHAELRRQLLPWLPWLTRFPALGGAQCARDLLVASTTAPATDLLHELGQVAMEHQGVTDTPAVDGITSLRVGLGPLADSIVEAGFSFAYETGRLAKRSRMHRLLFGRGKAAERIRRQGSGRIRERLIPVLDKLLRATLRSIARGIPVAAQFGTDHGISTMMSSRLSRMARLLRLRGRLFLAAGDYDRAYRFLLVAAAWGAEKGLPIYPTGIAAQLSGRFVEGEDLYRTAILNGTRDAYLLRNLGHVLLTLGREKEASDYLSWSARESYGFYMPHQNLAGGYDTQRFTPRAFDRADHPQTLLYDAYNLVGERLVHIGEGDRGLKCYGAALQKQNELASVTRLPDEIRKILRDEYGIPLDEPVRILPYEWVTLIGHIAMLDSYLKLQKLGMGKPGRPLLLAPVHKVANQTYLDLWRPHITVIDDPFLVDDLFPYQRAFGDCFNGYLRNDGTPADWTELGALGQIAWDATGQGPLISISDRLKSEGEKSLRKMGLGSSDWFVALHIRGTGFHRESKGSMQVHRNAAIDDYFPAMKAIVDAGGWVIRLGDASMEPLPAMERVVDYPHTEFKSEQCDIYLAATARFFIGTTSGLMNTVMSLGTPCLLVNCISNYFQLWNNRVLFTLKPLWNRVEGRYLSIAEMTSESLRWKIFNVNRLSLLGIEPHANTPDEIVAATTEMLRRVEGGKVMESTAADRVLHELCEAGGNRNYFGNGRLCESFFFSRRNDLFQTEHDLVNTDLAFTSPKVTR